MKNLFYHVLAFALIISCNEPGKKSTDKIAPAIRNLAHCAP